MNVVSVFDEAQERDDAELMERAYAETNSVEEVPALCPVCDVPLPEHHVTRWYSRRYDVWSEKMAPQGMTCFVVDLRRMPDEAALILRRRERAERGRRKGAKEGVDFHDPTLKRRAVEQTTAWRKAGRPKRRKRR